MSDSRFSQIECVLFHFDTNVVLSLAKTSTVNVFLTHLEVKLTQYFKLNLNSNQL